MPQNVVLFLIFACFVFDTIHTILLEKLGTDICAVKKAVQNISNEFIQQENQEEIRCKYEHLAHISTNFDNTTGNDTVIAAENEMSSSKTQSNYAIYGDLDEVIHRVSFVGDIPCLYGHKADHTGRCRPII